MSIDVNKVDWIGHSINNDTSGIMLPPARQTYNYEDTKNEIGQTSASQVFHELIVC